MEIRFEHIYALLLLLVIPALYFLYSKYNIEKKETSMKFSSLKIIKKSISSRSNLRKHLPFVLIIGMFCLIVIALANPQIPSFTTEKGINLAVVLDGSESMLATDYQPTRLEVSKQAVTSLIEKLNSKNNVGIILFESGATTISYLTPDKDRTLNSMASIQQGQGSTAIGDGLVLGIDMVTSIPDRKRVIVLLSDGVHNSGLITPEEAIQYAKLNDVQIFTVGLGSEKPIFIRNDIYGEPQFAELDEGTLNRIATETGGKYYKSVDAETLNNIFAAISLNLEYELEYSTIRDWFIVSALALLVINTYIIYGRYRIIV